MAIMGSLVKRWLVLLALAVLMLTATPVMEAHPTASSVKKHREMMHKKHHSMVHERQHHLPPHSHHGHGKPHHHTHA
jgi:hypothetical protein